MIGIFIFLLSGNIFAYTIFGGLNSTQTWTAEQNYGKSLLFVEPSSPTIGVYHANRPYKIYIASEVVVGNSIIINGNSIFSTELQENILAVSTSGVSTSQKFRVKELETETQGLRSNGRGKFKDADIEIETTNRGLILPSPNLKKWLLWVDDNGSLFTTQIAASPEISFDEREIRIKLQLKNTKKVKEEFAKAQDIINSTATVDAKIKAIEILLNNVNLMSSGPAPASGSAVSGAVGGGIVAAILGLLGLIKKKNG